MWFVFYGSFMFCVSPEDYLWSQFKKKRCRPLHARQMVMEPGAGRDGNWLQSPHSARLQAQGLGTHTAFWMWSALWITFLKVVVWCFSCERALSVSRDGTDKERERVVFFFLFLVRSVSDINAGEIVSDSRNILTAQSNKNCLVIWSQ